MDIHIRPYQDSDWLRICQIHDPARMDELRGSVDMAAFAPLEECFQSEGLFDGELWVAESEDGVVGFVGFDDKEITWLYVDTAYYRQGIGGRLLDFAIPRFKGDIHLDVLTGNLPAFRFYQKYGFEVLEKRKGHLSGDKRFPAEGYIMVLRK